MFEALAAQYYKLDNINEEFRNEIDACWQRAKTALKGKTIDFIMEKHSFHDWYLAEFTITAKQQKRSCYAILSRTNNECKLTFFDVISISINGELVSVAANYPAPTDFSSIAQVFSVWVDYQNCFECCLLLDSERFVIIKSKGICYEEVWPCNNE